MQERIGQYSEAFDVSKLMNTVQCEFSGGVLSRQNGPLQVSPSLNNSVSPSSPETVSLPLLPAFTAMPAALQSSIQLAAKTKDDPNDPHDE
mmetsp:Transcript_21410/g.51767  ORF Transcript_21410/g.51767 Transcript_21410/m.51767 type:complete len:91 (-) Transcript_21410:903-1175(-)